MAYLSRSYYEGDGTTTDFTVGFSYLNKAHVQVFVNGVQLTTGWSWVNDSTIRITAAPADGAIVLLKRATSPNARLVDFEAPSSLNEDDLDTDSLQAFYLGQEANDQANAGVSDDPATGQFTASGKRITNVADPVNDQDVATKKWSMTNMASQLAQAIASAAAALASQVAAAASAAAAAASATTANTKAGDASTSATAAASSATAASGSATAASGSATAAAGSATAAAGSATAAATSETNAAGSASTATTKATQAATSATNAATSETNAAASAAAAAASAGTFTNVQGQINAATDADFTDDDMLTARDGSTGNLLKRSWGNLKTLLSATAANIRANANSLFVVVSAMWSAAGEVALTDAATIAVDLNTFFNANVTLGGNRTLGDPTNGKVGQSGYIRIVQDATGSRTLAYHANWKFAGGTAPTLSTAANAVDLLFYQVISGKVYASLIKNV